MAKAILECHSISGSPSSYTLMNFREREIHVLLASLATIFSFLELVWSILCNFKKLSRRRKELFGRFIAIFTCLFYHVKNVLMLFGQEIAKQIFILRYITEFWKESLRKKDCVS